MSGLTSGERAVWAHVFVMWWDRGPGHGEIAAREASTAVHVMRSLDRSKLDEDQRAMLDDMLSTGADR